MSRARVSRACARSTPDDPDSPPTAGDYYHSVLSDWYTLTPTHTAMLTPYVYFIVNVLCVVVRALYSYRSDARADRTARGRTISDASS